MSYSGGYSKDLTTLKESIDPIIMKLANHHAPLLAKYTSLNPSGGENDPIIKQKQHYWINKRMKGFVDTTQAAINDSATTLYTNDKYVKYIAGKSVLLVDDEEMLVTACSYASSKWTLTVSRGYNSSTATAHAKGTKVIITAILHAEGADVDRTDDEYSEKDYNYLQIVRRELIHTRTQERLKTWADENTIEAQKLSLMPGMFREIQQSMIHGKRMISGTNEETYKMGGMRDFVASSMIFDNAGNVLDIKKVNDIVNVLGMKGIDIGAGNLRILGGKFVHNAIYSWKETRLQMQITDKNFEYNTEGVEIMLPSGGRLKVDPYCNEMMDDEAYIYPNDSIKVKYLDKFVTEDIGKTGDSKKQLLVSELTTEFKGWKLEGAAKIKNVAA